MFKIKGDSIYLTRGDKAIITLEIENYTFRVGDKIEFKVYKNKGLNELPVLIKEIELDKETQNVDITLTKEDTKIGMLSNRENIYWYEIELNKEQTILGYDEFGPKQLILYPEGADKDE